MYRFDPVAAAAREFGAGQRVYVAIDLETTGLIAGKDTVAHRFFELPVLVYMGKICYGLYLWHVPVFLLMRLNLKLGEAWEWTVGIALTFLLASLSHFLVEQRALALRHKFG